MKVIGFSSTERAFKGALSELEGSLIRINNLPDRTVVISLNSSVRDYLEADLARNSDTIRNLIDSDIGLDRLDHLASLSTESSCADLRESLRDARANVSAVLRQKIATINIQSLTTWVESRPKYNGWLNQVNKVLGISTAFDVWDIAESILATMGLDWIDSVTNADHLVELATIVTENQEMLDGGAVENIQQSVVEWAVMDTGDWDNASLACSMLRTLSGLDIPAAAEELELAEEALDRIAIHQVETWLTYDEPFEQVSEDYLRDIIGHIDGNPRLRFSNINGLDEARDALNLFNDARSDADYKAWQRSESYSSRHDPRSQSESRVQVESLMSLLDQDQ
jgi:hypothetical protein